MIDGMLRTVEEIRRLLGASKQLRRGQVAALSAAYGKACEGVNSKLERCRELLQAGKKAEALSIAKAAPDLREAVAALDLDEAETWLETCEKLGFPVQHRLQVEMARSLVAELYETGEFLKIYRRLSLGRAPLADRLRVLRALRAKDPEPARWAEDIRAFERARSEELARLVMEADRQGDLRSLDAILAELKSKEWTERPPGKLLRGTTRRAQVHRTRFAARRYEEIMESIRKAHSAMDEGACRRLVSEWKGVEEATAIPPEAKLAEEVAPVLAWLAGLDQERGEQASFEKAGATLERAVEDGEGMHRIEKLSADVLRFERGMPELVAARVSSRLDELRQAARRKFILRLAGVLCGLCIVGVIIGVVLVRHTRSQARERWRGRIASALDRSELEAAGRLLEQARTGNPAVFASPEIQELRNKHAQAVKDDSARKENFEKALKAVQGAGVASPNRDALERAGQLATTFDEKSAVQDWKEKIARHADEQRRAREAEIDKLIAELETAHGRVAEAKEYDVGNVDSLAESCLKLAKQVSAAEGITSLQKAKVASVEQSTIQLRDDARKNEARRKAVQKALEEVKQSYSDPERFGKALEAFSGGFPEHPLASEFLKAARMVPAWRSLAAWADVRSEWSTIRLSDGQTADARIPSVEKYLTEHPSGIQAASLAAYGDYLKAARRAMPDGRLRYADKLEEMLTNPLLASLFMLQDKEGLRFYSFKRPDVTARVGTEVLGYAMDCVIDERGSTRKVSVEKGVEKGVVPAPQIAFAEDALALLRKFDGKGWETVYLGLAEKALDSKGIDPVLRAEIVMSLLDYAINVAPPVKLPDVEQTANKLQKFHVPVCWMDPTDVDANQARRRMKTVLDGIASFKGAIATVDKALAEMDGALGAYRPAGVLLAVSSPPEFQSAPADGGLYVVTEDPGGRPALTRIGTVKGQQVTMNPGEPLKVPRGTIVFLRRE